MRKANLYDKGTRLRMLADLIHEGEREARFIAAMSTKDSLALRTDLAKRFRQVSRWAEEAATEALAEK